MVVVAPSVWSAQMAMTRIGPSKMFSTIYLMSKLALGYSGILGMHLTISTEPQLGRKRKRKIFSIFNNYKQATI